MVYDLVDKNDPILTKPTIPFEFDKYNSQDIATNLYETMKHHKGIGLAANQVGFPFSAFVIDTTPEVIVAFNPRITYKSEKFIEIEEACLSFPGFIRKQKRSDAVRIRFQAPDGEWYVKSFAGMTAAVIQHEMDHLSGITMLDGLSKLKISMMERKANKRLKRGKL